MSNSSAAPEQFAAIPSAATSTAARTHLERCFRNPPATHLPASDTDPECESRAAFGYSRRAMKKTLRTSIWRTLGLAAAIGVIGLSACDEGAPKDGSVFERDGSRAARAESSVRKLPVPDPGREAIAEVIRDQDPFSRARRLGTLLSTLGPDAVPQVESILADSRLLLHLGGTEIELLTRYWATHDPESASTWAVERSPLGYRTGAVFSSIPVWAKTDPFAAL